MNYVEHIIVHWEAFVTSLFGLHMFDIQGPPLAESTTSFILLVIHHIPKGPPPNATSKRMAKRWRTAVKGSGRLSTFACGQTFAGI